MSDVLFTGQFSLEEALAEFNKFASAIEARLGKISAVAAKASGGVAPTSKEVEAELKRQQKITDDHLKYNIAQVKKASKLETDIKLAEIKRQNKEKLEQQKFDAKVAKETLEFQVAKIVEARKADAKAAEEHAQLWQKAFTAFTVGGFALQRFGQFLTRSVTEPLIELGKSLLDTTLLVDDFEQTLKTRGHKSAEEIDEIYQAVLNVSNLPNMERPDVIKLFTRLTEATQGNITADGLEKIGKGLSTVMTTLESGERRAFFGQLQDILAGGNVANIKKTLSLVPLLGVEYNRLAEQAKSAGKEINQTDLVLQALGKLGGLPVIHNLSTAIKAIRNELFEFERRISKIYKVELQQFVTFISDTLLPKLEQILIWFEKASPLVHNFAIALGLMLAALGPLVSVLGSFGILIGGLGFAFEALKDFSAGVGGLFGADGIVGALAQIPALLNPIVLAIVAIIGYVTYLTVNNMGGLQDALKTLVGEGLENVYSSLKLIQTTTDALIKLVVSFQEIVGPLVGFVLARIADITSSLLAVNAQLQTALASLIQFLTDIPTDGIELAWEKLMLSMYKSLKRFQDAFPVLGKLGENLAKTFTDDTQTIDEAIAKQEKKIKDLGGTIDGETKTIEKVSEAHSDWEAHIIATAKATGELTNELNKQADAIDKVLEKSNKSTEDTRRQLDDYLSSTEVKNLRDQAGEFDLSNPAEQKKAYAKLLEANALNLQQAQIKAQETLSDKLQETLTRQRQEMLKFAQDEQRHFLRDFYAQALQIYNEGGSAGQIAQKLNAASDKFQLESGLLFPVDVKVIRANIAKRAAELNQLQSEAAASNHLILRKAADDNARAIKEFEKKTQDIADQRAELAAKEPLYGLLGDAEFKIANAEEIQRNLTKDRNDILSIADLREKMNAAMQVLINAEEEKYKVEKQFIEVSTKTQLEREKALDTLNRKHQDALNDISIRGNKQVQDTVFGLTHDRAENSKRIRDLLVTFGDEWKANIDLMNTLAAYGVKPDLANVHKAIDAFNQIIIDSAGTLSSAGLQPLLKASEQMRAFGKQFGSVEGINGFLEFLDKIQEMGTRPLTKTEIDGLLLEAEGVVNFLKKFLLLPNLTDDQSADLNLYIDKIIKSIEQLKATRKSLSDIKDTRITDGEIQLSELEHQKEMNDLTHQQLELEEQILEIRQDRLTDSSLPNISRIWAIISGSQRKIDEAREKILENQKKAAQLDLEIALERLQIEQWILEKKIQESNASQEEKDKEIKASQDLYEKQVEQIKAKGALEQELLDEQIKSLGDSLSGSGGLLDTIFSAVFRKKKKQQTGTIDKDGNYVVNGNEKIDPDAINAGQLPALIPDDAADKTAKNANKQITWLDKLTGRMGKARDLIFSLGDAVSQLNDLTIKGILAIFAAELSALSKKAAIKALEYAAVAVSALVTGDVGTAIRAGKAAAMWTAVAVAAGAAAHFLGGVAGTSAGNAQSSASSAAGVPNGDYSVKNDTQILKQKALSVWFYLDIRTDEGIIIKKNIKALNENTELTNLTLNSADGWSVSPAP